MAEYYLPSIAEFNFGFEYEHYGNRGWQKSIFPESDIHANLRNMEIAINHEEVRARYLDSQDIQELGWQWDEENGVFKISCWFESRRDYFDVHLHYVPKSCHLLLFEGDFDSVPEKQSSTVFYVGKCYNKSELKWIMDRLDIKTEKRE